MSAAASTASGAAGAAPDAARIPVLDGVRAAAFIMVLLFHSFEVWQRGPVAGALAHVTRLARTLWIGVDLFFVLSGFLITGILLASKGSQNYFKRFYFRRSIRILPPYYLFLGLLMLYLYGSTHDAAELLTWERLSYWLFLQNVSISWSGWDSLRPINHLWTLAVEEQFYLVWPIVILLAPAKRLAPILLLIIGGAFCLRAVLLCSGHPGGVYVSTPTRMDSLAAGALLAVTAADAGGRRWLAAHAARSLAACAAAFVAVVLWRRGYEIGDPVIQWFGFSLTAFLFAALIATLMFSDRASVLKSVLSNRILQWLGRRSYVGYLIHWPVVLMVDHALPATERPTALGVALTIALSLAITVVLAELSWRGYESFWRRLRSSLEARFAI
jgi:peptidoglycan/LPS O-acetylase OafA/YrhL